MEREANPDLDEESAEDLEEKKVEVKAPQEKGSGKEKATSPNLKKTKREIHD